MRYMVIETFKTGMQPRVYERLSQRGRLLPRGLVYIDSWLEADGNRCFQLMESENEQLFETWTAQWSDLVDFEIVAVQSTPVQRSSN